MSARYRITGNWSIDTVDRLQDTAIVTLVCDLVDNHGNVFRDGAWKVQQDGKAVKLFKGETAWNDAQRLHDDLVYAARRQEAGL